MNTTIYYFTGTGNSLAAAKYLKEKLIDCDLKSIPKSLQNNAFDAKSEITGFIFPNYYGKVPKLVREFIIKLNIDSSNYIFTAVIGGGTSGDTHSELKKILKKKGKTLNTFYEALMPGNYIIAPYYPATNRDKAYQNNKIREAKKVLDQLAETIKNKGNKIVIGGNVLRTVTRIFNIYNNLSNYSKWDKYYNAMDNCNSCSTCEKICPVKNIKLVNGKPVWNHNCQMCMACIQNCPKEAIQFKNDTYKRNRYRNPEVKLQELIN